MSKEENSIFSNIHEYVLVLEYYMQKSSDYFKTVSFKKALLTRAILAAIPPSGGCNGVHYLMILKTSLTLLFT